MSPKPLKRSVAPVLLPLLQLVTTMQLQRDGTELPLAGELLLSASYTPRDSGVGSLNLCCANAITYDQRSISVPLDPSSPEGYKVEQGLGGKVLVVCGAARIVVIELSCLRVAAAIPLEYEECERQGLPWFVSGEDVMLIATETRVFCLDGRLAFRWCWTAATHSKDRFEISEAPIIDGTAVQIALATLGRSVDVRLDILDAATLS